jgi:hypothetical protein
MDSGRKQAAIYARFIDEEILSEMGRLAFYALNIFSRNGYHIYLFDNLDFEKLEKERPYIRLVESIDNLAMIRDIPEDTANMIYLYDREDKQCASREWWKKLQIRFDIFSSYFWSSFTRSDPVFMPYPMHPLLYTNELDSRLESGRKQDRSMRIFFSGDTEGYRRNRIHYPESKLTRSEIINTVLEMGGDTLVTLTDSESHERLLHGEYKNKFVLADNSSYRIDSGEWLETIAKSDFFLCPPGYVMPMCHNVTEAMAVGTIPVINYPEWMTPGLVDMENCIAFSSREELVSKIRLVLELGNEKIYDLRSSVIDYYRKYLDPASFIDRLESRPEKKIPLLMITDAYVAKHADRLNRNSILITGRPHGPARLLAGIRDSMISG